MLSNVPSSPEYLILTSIFTHPVILSFCHSHPYSEDVFPTSTKSLPRQIRQCLLHGHIDMLVCCIGSFPPSPSLRTLMVQGTPSLHLYRDAIYVSLHICPPIPSLFPAHHRARDLPPPTNFMYSHDPTCSNLAYIPTFLPCQSFINMRHDDYRFN